MYAWKEWYFSKGISLPLILTKLILLYDNLHFELHTPPQSLMLVQKTLWYWRGRIIQDSRSQRVPIHRYVVIYSKISVSPLFLSFSFDCCAFFHQFSMGNPEFCLRKRTIYALSHVVHHWKLRNESSVEPSPTSNQEYCGNKLVTISIVFIILNTIFVILRFYARSITKTAYGWDDYLIIASFISNISLCVVSISMYALFYHLPLSLWYQFCFIWRNN